MDTAELTTIPGTWDFQYTYFAGETASRFFNALKTEGRIYATICPKCARKLVPARSFCDACYVAATGWEQVGPAGTLDIFTIVATQFPGLPPPPFVIAYVTLDGASTAILNHLTGVDLSDIDRAAAFLMTKPRVVARFSETREGRITDFHFALAPREQDGQRAMNGSPANGADGLGEMIASSAAALFQRFGARTNMAARRDVEAGLADPPAWAEIEQAGFPLAMLDEEAGGVGAVHAFTIVRLAAVHAFISPLAETMGANWLLARAGLAPARGPAAFAEAVFDLRRHAGGWRLSGAAHAVAWARGASELVALARHDGRFSIVRLDPAQAQVTRGANLAGEQRDTLVLDEPLGEAQLGAAPAGFDGLAVRKLGAALRTAQMAGAASGVLDMTVQHVSERKQFGRKLGAFQAVQQLLATMATQSAAACVSADLAGEAVAGHLDPLVIAAAKIRAGEAAGLVAAGAHQLHGAIGFTQEHPLQILTRRLLAWRDDFGGEAAWSIQLGRALVNSNQPALWPQLTAI